MLIYSNDQLDTLDNELVRPGRYPDYRIINQSHMSMGISPTNDLYGKKGKILVCNGNEWPVFSACLYYRGGRHWYGSQGTESPDGVPVARTTFNPDFSGLMELYDEVFHIEIAPK
ncbi:MAG: hypothetical protein GKR95_04775 [Gammaproteobacteria bacterium]|nr:hypothetical protein [Gammaproteobacteria bacterium]